MISAAVAPFAAPRLQAWSPYAAEHNVPAKAASHTAPPRSRRTAPGAHLSRRQQGDRARPGEERERHERERRRELVRQHRRDDDPYCHARSGRDRCDRDVPGPWCRPGGPPPYRRQQTGHREEKHERVQPDEQRLPAEMRELKEVVVGERNRRQQVVDGDGDEAERRSESGDDSKGASHRQARQRRLYFFT